MDMGNAKVFAFGAATGLALAALSYKLSNFRALQRCSSSAKEDAQEDASVAIPQRLGFIGVGTINSAVARGLLKSDPSLTIVVGPRSKAKAEALRDEYPDRVTILAGNQEVVDASDWVFLATPPPPRGDPAATLGPLVFQEGQTVISLVACVSRDVLQGLVAPARVVQTFPLPAAQHNCSAVVASPDFPEVTALLDRLGKAVAVDDAAILARLVPMTCVMGHFYATQRVYHEWLVAGGVDSEKATVLVAQMARTFNHASLDAREGFDELVAEQTPGGVNESVIANFTKSGHYDALRGELDRIAALFA